MLAPVSIARKDMMDAARLLGGIFATFTARDFLGMAQTQYHDLEEEAVNEYLLDFVKEGALREIGPGVYAIAWTGRA